jgi:small subunit ribosomal protein S1
MSPSPSSAPDNESASATRGDPRTDLDARLEAEITAALGDMSIEDMLDDEERPGALPAGPDRAPQRQARRGTIVSVHGNDVIVEFGPKSQGVCDASQFDSKPEVGQQLEFVIERFDKREGLLVLSRGGAVSKAAWDTLGVGQTIEARCVAVNKGGLELEVAQHRAFMPAGHVDLRHVDNLERFVGEKLTCEIMELDRKTGRIILSRRIFLEAERARRREETLHKLDVGMEVTGTVTSLQPFGAFVDIGGVDGLIHISDLSYKRIGHPREVVREGEQVTVRVLKIDDRSDPPKIGLSLKQTMSDPFMSLGNELREGGTVTGRVTRIMPYGAFVEIAPGVEGLIHISELSHDRVGEVRNVVKPDEIVTVKVLAIDREQQRISLSLKAMKAKEELIQERRLDQAMEKLKTKYGSGKRGLKGGLG